MFDLDPVSDDAIVFFRQALADRDAGVGRFRDHDLERLLDQRIEPDIRFVGLAQRGKLAQATNGLPRAYDLRRSLVEGVDDRRDGLPREPACEALRGSQIGARRRQGLIDLMGEDIRQSADCSQALEFAPPDARNIAASIIHQRDPIGINLM